MKLRPFLVKARMVIFLVKIIEILNNYCMKNERIEQNPGNAISSNYVLDRSRGKLNYKGDNLNNMGDQSPTGFYQTPKLDKFTYNQNCEVNHNDPIIVEENLEESCTISLDPENI